MSFTLVQQIAGSVAGSASSGTLTFSGLAGAPNFLTAQSAVSAGTELITGIAQTNVSWFFIGRSTIGGNNTEHWIGIITGVPGAVATVSVSPTSVALMTLLGQEWTPPSVGTLGYTFTPAGGTSISPLSTTLTPTAGRDTLFIGTVRKGGSQSPAGPTSGGFTALTNTIGAYRNDVSPAATPVSVGWTYATSTAWDVGLSMISITPVPPVVLRPWLLSHSVN